MRRRGVYRADWSGERIKYQSDKSREYWSNQSKLDQSAQNNDSIVERSKHILEEIN